MIRNLFLFKENSILLAEDDTITRNELGDIFAMLFAKVIVATNGKEAYRLYTEESPDIIVTDIKMPHMDGLSLIKMIRQDDYRTPIILLTSFANHNLIEDAANLSIDGYLLKPVDLEKLTYTICKAMKRIAQKQKLISLTKELSYNFATKELYRNGAIIELGAKERMLLQLFIENPLRTLTKAEIGKALWPLDPICNSAIKNIVLRVRKKLTIEIIISIRGIGYRLKSYNKQ